MALVLVLCLIAGAASLQTGPSPILLEQRQRELVMVRHLRQHVVDPGDGLALAADRRDLQRLRSGAPPAMPAPLLPTAPDDELVDAIGGLVDLWYVRLVERQPFVMMPRERVAALERVHQAVGQLQSRGRTGGLQVWLPDVMVEVNALLGAMSGQGELQDASIDVALRLADAAAAGRPMLAPGPYPPGPYPPPGSQGGPGASPAGPPPPPPGPTPYALPPVYQEYGQQAAGTGSYAACQTLRVSAGVSQSVNDMLRAAECWMRTPGWPGWGEQSIEALDWALGIAAAERNCQALSAVVESMREIGPRLATSRLMNAVTALAKRGDADRRRLQSQSLCR